MSLVSRFIRLHKMTVLSLTYHGYLQIFLPVNLGSTDVPTTSVSLIVNGVMGKLIVMGEAMRSIAVRGVKSLQRPGTEGIRTHIQPSKPKREIT